MKFVTSRSMSLVCLLVSGLSLSAVAQAGAAAPGAAANSAAPSAPSTSASKIAVINFQGAVAQTNEGQRNFSELQKKFDPKRTALKTQSDEVDALKKQLQTAGANLSDTERQTRLKSIDEKEKALQRSAEDAQNDFQQAMQETYQQLAEKVYGVLQSYAQQNGYSVVLDAAASQQQAPTVLWANQGTDITKAVIEAYNTKSGIPAQPSVPSAPAPAHSSTAPTRAPAGAAKPQ